MIIYTETKMSSFWRNFHHWLHRKLSFWQFSVQPVMKISSKWRHFRFSVRHFINFTLHLIRIIALYYFTEHIWIRSRITIELDFVMYYSECCVVGCTHYWTCWNRICISTAGLVVKVYKLEHQKQTKYICDFFVELNTYFSYAHLISFVIVALNKPIIRWAL